MDKIDLLYPLKENNRQEHFLVDYDGFIKNTAEAVAIMLDVDREENLKKYPNLDKIWNNDETVLYNNTLLFSPEQLLAVVSNNELSPQEIRDEINSLFSRYNIIEFQRTTIFEFALYNILGAEFTKSVDIINRRGFQKYEIEYLSKSYKKYLDKVKFYDGNIDELIKTGKYTTILLNNPDSVVQALNTLQNEILEKTLFILRINLDTVNIDFKKPEERYKYQAKFNELIKDKQRAITYMYTDCIQKEPVLYEEEPKNIG